MFIVRPARWLAARSGGGTRLRRDIGGEQQPLGGPSEAEVVPSPDAIAQGASSPRKSDALNWKAVLNHDALRLFKENIIDGS